MERLLVRPRYSGDMTGIGLYFLIERHGVEAQLTLYADKASISSEGIIEISSTIRNCIESFQDGL